VIPDMNLAWSDTVLSDTIGTCAITSAADCGRSVSFAFEMIAAISEVDDRNSRSDTILTIALSTSDCPRKSSSHAGWKNTILD